MIAERLERLMADRALSQSELARRVGVSQQTIFKLVRGESYGSRYIHRIARALETSPSYLEGETDDPTADAPAPLPAPNVQLVSLPVALPSEAALREMFHGLLLSEGRNEPELAAALARSLPIGLAAAQVGRVSLPPEFYERDPAPADDAPPAKQA